MKLFIKFLIFILVLGLAGPFFIRRPDGQPWLSVDDVVPNVSQISAKTKRWWRDIGSDMGDATEAIVDGEVSDGLKIGKTKVYRWRDEYGKWQFSDRPNPQGESEAVWLDDDKNVIAGKPANIPSQTNTNNPAQEGNFAVPLPLTVSPDQVNQLMEGARNVQQLMDSRQEVIEQAAQ